MYWTTHAAGTVMKCSKSGCGGGPAQIAYQQNLPWSIAVSGGNVFWVEELTGVVRVCPTSGCTGAPASLGLSYTPNLSQSFVAQNLAVAATGAYWGTQTSLVRCPATGCAGNPTVLDPAHPGGIVAVDAASVYWIAAPTTVNGPATLPTAARSPAAGGAGHARRRGGRRDRPRRGRGDPLLDRRHRVVHELQEPP